MRLLLSKPEDIPGLLNSMHREAKAITENVYYICAYMRNISRSEAWSLTHQERDIISKIIKDKIKTMSESKGSVNLL